MSNAIDPMDLLEDRDRGYLNRWCEAIEHGFEQGDDAREHLLRAYRQRVWLDFWHEMQELAGVPGEMAKCHPSKWAEVAARAVLTHNRGMCASGGLDDHKSEVLMDVVQKTLHGILTPRP